MQVYLIVPCNRVYFPTVVFVSEYTDLAFSTVGSVPAACTFDSLGEGRKFFDSVGE